MALTVEKTTWNQCQNMINSLTAGNQYLTPYSSFDFLDRIKSSPNIHRIFEAKKFRLECYAVRNGQKVVLVAPLLVNRKNKKLCLLGEFSSVGHLDFIYDQKLSTQELKKALKMILAQFDQYVLSCSRISQFSLLKQLFDEEHIDAAASDICVKIDLSTYEQWYQSLSKSCRQNIRTSYNRLNSDGAEMKFVCLVKEKPSGKLWNDHLVLFSKRILEHTKLPKFLLLPMFLLKKTERLSKALYEAKNTIFSSVYINGKLAASLHGVLANDGRAIITRLSIDIGLGRYSPGGLLLNETVKAVCNNHHCIKALDLSRGEEPYKYVYGGKEHYNFSYEIMAGDII